MKEILAFDMGGTKVAMGRVSDRGEVVDYHREEIDKSRGPEGLRDQLLRLAEGALQKAPQLKFAVIAGAGPLNPQTGELLDPTNLKTDGKSWGVYPLIAELEKKSPLKWRLENDAAAAVLAENWVGESQGVKNCVQLTLGTGLGVGVICNGQLLRSGRHLHPEASHIKINAFDVMAPCGCGDLGCLEAYLSGYNFTRRLAHRWGWAELRGEQLLKLLRAGDPKALAEMEEYADLFAIGVSELVALFSPEVIAISGGFSEALDFFLPRAEKKLEELLRRRREGIDLKPLIKKSRFSDQINLIGAAAVAFHG